MSVTKCHEYKCCFNLNKYKENNKVIKISAFVKWKGLPRRCIKFPFYIIVPILLPCFKEGQELIVFDLN